MGKFKGRRLDETGRILSRKSWASRFGSAKGQDMVEFAMVASLFFLLLFAVMDYGWLMFAQLNVQQAVDDGGRYASTGQEGSSGSRIAGIVSFIQNEISVPGVNVAQNITICSIPSGGKITTCYNSGAGSGNTGAAGAPAATVTITLTTPLTLMTPLLSTFFPGGKYTFTSSSTFKNEPFNPNNTN